jgi:hypothetical protein
MTGRDIYEALTDTWLEARPAPEENRSYRPNGRFLQSEGPAWAFLSEEEKQAFDLAAELLSAPDA